MTFLTSGAFVDFVANTKAKSAEVDANFATLYNFLATTTSDLVVGNTRIGYVSTSGSCTITSAHTFEVIGVSPQTTTESVFLPTSSNYIGRRYTVIHKGSSSYPVTIQSQNGSDTVGFSDTYVLTTGSRKKSVTFVSDGAGTWLVESEFRPSCVLQKTGDYSISSHDNGDVFAITTNASTATVTLPQVADNNGRIIHVAKVDSGAGTVLVDGYLTETIDGTTSVSLVAQHHAATFFAATTSGWVKLSEKGVSGTVSLYVRGGGTASGPYTFNWTKNDKIVCLSVGNGVTATHSTNAGTVTISADTASASWPSYLTPSKQHNLVAQVVEHGAIVNTPGLAIVAGTGITILKTLATGGFDTSTTTARGIPENTVFTYAVAT